MNFLRRAFEFLADLLDRVREPGWPRRIAVMVILVLVMFIPYPLSITGNFEMISVRPVSVRNMTPGTVTEVLVEMDALVTEGQPVVRLLDIEKKLEIAKVDAQIVEASARLKMMKKGFREEEIETVRYRVQELQAAVRMTGLDLRRQETLVAENAVAVAELDRTRSENLQARKVLDQAKQELLRLTNGYRPEEIEQAVAAVEQLEGQRAELAQHLEWTVLHAPKAGRVITSDAELRGLVGKYLERGSTALEIINTDDLVARIRVEESEFGDVSLKQRVSLRPFQFPTMVLSGNLDSIEPFVEKDGSLSTTVSVLSKISDPQKLLRVHTTGKAKISLGSRPLGSVIYRRVLRSLFVQAWSWY